MESTGIDTLPDDSVQECAVSNNSNPLSTFDSARDTERKKTGVGIPITAEQAQILYDAVESGETLKDAGKLAGMSPMSAWRLMRGYEGSLESARKFLSAKALRASEDWIRASGVAGDKGNHLPAKDLLLHIGAIEPIQDASTGRVNIAILIGTPEQPIRVMSPQTIDSKALVVDEV